MQFKYYEILRTCDRWEDNIKVDLKEITWGGSGLTHLAEDRN